MPMPHSESMIFHVEEDQEDEVSVFDENQFFDAEEYRDSADLEEKFLSSVLSHDSCLLLNVDNLCPAWIEVLVHRGNYARTYALNLPHSNDTILRKAEWVLEAFGSEVPNDNICSPRMSSAEKTRRHLGQLLASKAAEGPLHSLQATGTRSMFDTQFLKRKRPSNLEKGKVHASGFVARALSDHHWLEEWATVSERGINFYHPDRKKANFRVPIHTITRVASMSPEEAPSFPSNFFLSFETLGRTTYLMFASQVERNEWAKIVSGKAKLSPSSVDSMETSSEGNASTALIELQNPKDEFLHKSSMWDFKHRRVLNCRRFSFGAREESSGHDPLFLAEDALRKALDPRNESDDDILVDFLDSAAKLKEAMVHELEEDERLSFFLNVYHTMVMHAYLVLGVPKSSFQWISYFNSISYQCSDDIFSLAELEHCIIRASMSFPTQFLSRFVLPKSTYDFALKKSEPRITFALNCGSRSNPKCVPVFLPTSLNQQLDDTTKLYLSAAVKVKQKGSKEVEVYLPRMCLWFSNDFGSSNEHVLRRMKQFMTQEVRDFLNSCMLRERGKCQVSVKYLPYSFECRKLSLTPDSGGGNSSSNP